jgi:hypothetical protein
MGQRLTPKPRPAGPGPADTIRSGAWLTPERLKTYPALTLVLLVFATIALVATGHGNLDRFGRPLGTDFSQIWVAGQEIAAGDPAMPYDNAANATAQDAAFGPSDSYYVWPYPPYFLAVAALFGAFPYLLALALWQGTTLPLYLAAVLRPLRGSGLPTRAVLVAALAFPAVFINLMHGHNGFLTAGLIGFGAALLPRRPVLAGALLALLAYKPQFALAIPVALLAGQHWRALAAGVVTLAAMTAASFAAFGIAPWRAFLASTGFTRKIVLEQGATGWEKIQSAFAAARGLGASIPAAYAIQGLVTLGVLAALASLWRGGADWRLKMAALLAASLLSTPYVLDYDMVVLGPALASAVAYGREKGFAPYEKSLFALLWIAPLLARPVGGLSGLPVGLLAMLGFFAIVVRRVWREAPQGVRQDGLRASHPAP